MTADDLSSRAASCSSSHMGRASARRGARAALASVFSPTLTGASLRVEETFVRQRGRHAEVGGGATHDRARPALADELFRPPARSAFEGDDERVFANPRTGASVRRRTRYAELVRTALERAGIEGYVRPSHDLRHSSITNAAAAGTSPEALMAGRATRRTRRRGATSTWRVRRFRDEADLLEAPAVGRIRYEEPVRRRRLSSPAEEAEEPQTRMVERRGWDLNPRDALHAQRFSRPPRSTAPAPRREP